MLPDSKFLCFKIRQNTVKPCDDVHFSICGSTNRLTVMYLKGKWNVCSTYIYIYIYSQCLYGITIFIIKFFSYYWMIQLHARK